MEKEILVKLIDEGKSQREIAKELSLSQSGIRHWLRKYDLKSKNEKYNKRTGCVNKYCVLCGNEMKNNPNNRTKCNACFTRIRRYRTKKKAVEYLGGVCVNCGWSGNIAAFEFHHINDKKEFAIGSASNKSWKIVEKELDKCELLCSICHRIKHSKYNDKDFLEEVNKYQGN